MLGVLSLLRTSEVTKRNLRLLPPISFPPLPSTLLWQTVLSHNHSLSSRISCQPPTSPSSAALAA